MRRWWLTLGVLLLAGLVRAEEAKIRKANLRLRIELDSAHALLRQGDPVAAEQAFRQIADQLEELNPATDEARFYQAECLRLQARYPQAARVYVQALREYPFGERRTQAIQVLYGLANYWLDDTREEIRLRQSGSWVLPLAWVWTWNPSKPFLTQEAEAMNLLEVVTFSDPTGPLAEKALFLMGSVHFFRCHYAEAAGCFTRLVQEHPESPLAPLGLVRAVVARRRSLATGPSDQIRLAELIQLVSGGLADRRYVDEEDRDLLCRQLPWVLWREYRGLIPACLRSLAGSAVENRLPEFAPGSKYQLTFLTQQAPATALVAWSSRLSALLAAPCCPCPLTMRLLVELSR